MDYLMDKKEIGSRLKELRIRRGYKSQDKFAEALGISERKTVGKWETGDTAIPTTRLAEICEVLDCDLDYLFGKIDVPRNTVSDICKETGLSESAVYNLKKYDYFYLMNGTKVADGCSTGLEPSAVLSRLLESEAFWRVIGNLSMWTKTEVQELFEMADQYDPLSEGLPTMPGYMEPNPAKVPFTEKHKTADLYVASAARHFGDAVEKIFEDLRQKK